MDTDVAAKIKALTARAESAEAEVGEWREVARWFCNRVESGEVRSTRTYERFKALLERPAGSRVAYVEALEKLAEAAIEYREQQKSYHSGRGSRIPVKVSLAYYDALAAVEAAKVTP